MLYECWRQMAREYSAELALLDLPSGRRWTFAELAAAAEAQPFPDAPFVFPRGSSAEFVLDVLRGWSDGKIVFPLEHGQTPPEVDQAPSHCVHLKSTSATTGPPRLIAFTAEQLMADSQNIVASMGLRSDWPNLGVISLAHSYGFSNLVLPLVLHGIPLLLSDSPLPEAIRKAAGISQALTLPGVPALWRAWQNAGAIVPNIKLAISAGAPLPLNLEADIYHQCGIKVHNFYGASECGGIGYDSTETPRTEAGFIGAPLQNVAVSVAEDGCLEVRSRAVAETYLPKSIPTLANGCYRTSDVAELVDGLIYLRGRAGDLINVAGRKVAPQVIERVLAEHPCVRDCLVFGFPDANAERGELIVACIALNGPVSADALRKFSLSRLPDWQVPRDWWFVEALPVNERGKLSRADWRRKYGEMKGALR